MNRILLRNIRLAGRALVLAAIAACACNLTGCTYGFIYTNETRPLVTNFDQTPVGTRSGEIGTRQIREPITAANISALWRTRAIGDAAQKEKLSTIYYADRTVFSILGGIWREDSVTVWGE
jgi:hypothetical protein